LRRGANSSESIQAWTNRISPFYWVPTPFVETAEVGDMIGVTAVAVARLATAFVGFYRRDVITNCLTVDSSYPH
jgi:hypothetical protein